MNEKISIHEGNSDITGAVESLGKWDVNENLKKDIVKFLDDLRLGKVNSGKRVSDRTACKYISLLRSPSFYFNKPLNKITLKDIENFERDLTSDKVISERKKAYSYNSKCGIRVAVKVILKWKLGEAKALELAGWLDTRDKEKTPDYLKEVEIDKLYKSCKSAHERYMIAVLFDAGARAEEFLNIRFEDIQLPEGKDTFVKLTLKEEYSKTKGRVISLFWRHSLEAVRDFLTERQKEGIKSTDPVFNMSYDACRFFLNRLSMKALGKSIHFHLFRHSSATFYATRLNRQELCYRYGWKFSSDMPDVYISRSGMQSKELDEKFKSTELTAVQDELAREKQNATMKYEKLEREMEEMKKNIHELVHGAVEPGENIDELLTKGKSRRVVIQTSSK